MVFSRLPLITLGLAFQTIFSAAALGKVASVETPEGKYELTFDPRKVRADVAKSTLSLNPHIPVPAVGVLLEDCDPKDRAYKGCGDDVLGDKHFLANALVNISKARAQVRALKGRKVPRGLAVVKEYFMSYGLFYLWAQKTRYEFIRTGATYPLKQSFRGIEPAKDCAQPLERIEKAATPSEGRKLARVDWHNCVNLVANRRFKEYPVKVWEDFLARNGMSGSLVVKERDSE